MNHNKECLLLDLDGTLINSEKAFFESFKKILYNNFSVLISEEDYRKNELEKNAMLLDILKKQNLISSDVSNDYIMKLIYDDYETEFRKVIIEKEALENFELLKLLKEKYFLALVTTCRRYYLDILIKELHLENLFDVIIAREDVKNLKPASDAYLMAIQELGVKKENCLAFEDSKRGIDAAVNCDINTVQVSNFTSIKYVDDRAINFSSANYAFKLLLDKGKLR